jgi:hypothetical protein
VVSKLTWAPEFGVQQLVQPSNMLAAGSTISEDDTARVYVDWKCQVDKPAYASLVFQGKSGAQSAVFLLRPDSKVATRLKASIPAAKLKEKVHFSDVLYAAVALELQARDLLCDGACTFQEHVMLGSADFHHDKGISV